MDDKFLEQMALSWLNDCRSDVSLSESYRAGFYAAEVIYLAQIEQLEKQLAAKDEETK